MKAKIALDRDFVIGRVSRLFWGSFIEHLGRSIYGGIYEPGHPKADANGFRRDVIDIIRELNVPIIRYPGGNYTSSYDWRDSVGPVAERRARPDLAWRSLEPNTFGLAEFVRWTKEVSADILMTLNMGSQGMNEALELVEYCNFPRGSYWSDLRRRHGQESPYGIKHWCLGNEIDGPWQVGQKSAAEYARVANETAKAMKLLDPTVRVCACGSSFRKMPSFPEWDETVLDVCYDTIDYLSLHSYLRNEHKDRATYLAESRGMEDFIEIAVGLCDKAREKHRSNKTIEISFDEWNVWPRAQESDRDLEPWRVGPPLLEESYTMEDAVVFGCMMNVLLRHADRITMTCMSLLVNAISPIMTENGGTAWRQTTFYPFKYATRYARGESLRVAIDCPVYQNAIYGPTPYVDAAATLDGAHGEAALFCVNRHENEPVELELALGGFSDVKVLEHVVLRSDDPLRGNTKQEPEAVVPVAMSGAVAPSGARLSLPPFSWNLIRIGAAAR